MYNKKVPNKNPSIIYGIAINSKSALYLCFVILFVIATMIKQIGANKKAEIIRAISTKTSPHKLFGFLNITNKTTNISHNKWTNNIG